MAEILGTVSAGLAIADTLITSTLKIKELCESYQSAQANLNLIRTRVITIKAVLSQVEEWCKTTAAAQSNEEVKSALKEVVESITTVLDGIAESLKAVEEAWKPGLRYLWDESKLAGFGRDLSNQVGDLHFLFNTVNWTRDENAQNVLSEKSAGTFPGDSINGCVRRAASIASGYTGINSRRRLIRQDDGPEKTEGDALPASNPTPPKTPSNQPIPPEQDLQSSSTTIAASSSAVDTARRSSLLLSAVKTDSVEGLKNLLSLGVDVNTNVDGTSILSQCVQHGSVQATRFMLESGANIRSQDLVTATETGNYQIVRRLLLRGAAVNSLGHTSDLSERKSALHVAASSGDRDITKLLLEHNANINQKSESGFTPLHTSSDETICILLDHGASVFAKDNKGRIPLHTKAREGRLFAVQTLIEHGSPLNLRDYQGVTPIISAVLHGNNALVTELIRAGANVHARVSAEALCTRVDKDHWKAQLQDLSLLHFAVSTPNCKVDVLRTLIDAGIPVDIRSADGSTPLQWSCLPPHLFRLSELGTESTVNTPPPSPPFREASEAAKFLIRRGANINIKNNRMWTPLHTAALNDTYTVAKLLLENGASTSAREDWARTPLRVAINHNSDKVVRLLLANSPRRGIEFESLHAAAFYDADKAAKALIHYGADNGRLNAEGKTALHVACERNSMKVAEVLVRYGADLEALDQDGCTPLLTAAANHTVAIARLLLEHGADIHHTDKDGLAPLHHAARNNSVQMASLLLRRGADVNHRGRGLGVRPLHAAAWRNSVAVAEVLVANGADVNASDGKGWTALHDAASKDSAGVLKLLVECGGDVNRVTRRTGSGVLDIAADYKASQEVVDCIVLAGGRICKRDRRRVDYM